MRTQLAIALPIALLFTPSIATGATIYSNTFTNGFGTQTSPIGDIGWNSLRGNSITATVEPSNTSHPYVAGVFNGASPSGSPTLNDYIYVQKSGSTAASATDIDFIMRTNDSTITAFAPTNYTSLTVSWDRNGGNNVAGHYFMVQTGGAWYVSTTAYGEFGAGQSPNPALNLLTSTWTNLDLSGGFLAIGATPYTYNTLFGAGQTITGIGFYIDNLTGVALNGTTQSFRLDNIVIDAIPEPSTTLLGAAGAMAGLTLRRRSGT